MTPKSASVRIVLVEDNPGDVYLVETSLTARQIPYELIHYRDGEQAIDALSDDNVIAPDAILVDLNLPRREGFDVLKSVRQSPRLVGVPVGVFTSSDAVKDRHRTALLGADMYIHKPLTLEDFVEHVGKSIEELLAHRAGP